MVIEVLLLAVCVGAASPIHSQETHMVFVHVTALTERDGIAADLKREDFTVLEDRSPQVVQYLSHSDEPMSLVVVFDATAGMPAKIRAGQAALAELVHMSAPTDDMGLIVTQDEARIAVPLGGSRSEIERLADTSRPGGFRALWDGMVLGLNELQHSRYQRKAMVVISDGGDETSRHTLAELRRLLQEADVDVYGIGTLDRYAGRLTARTKALQLDEVFAITGGRGISAYKEADFVQAAARVSQELRGQYVLGFCPTHQNRQGEWRELEIRPSESVAPAKLRLHYRKNYYVAAD